MGGLADRPALRRAGLRPGLPPGPGGHDAPGRGDGGPDRGALRRRPAHQDDRPAGGAAGAGPGPHIHRLRGRPVHRRRRLPLPDQGPGLRPDTGLRLLDGRLLRGPGGGPALRRLQPSHRPAGVGPARRADRRRPHRLRQPLDPPRHLPGGGGAVGGAGHPRADRGRRGLGPGAAGPQPGLQLRAGAGAVRREPGGGPGRGAGPAGHQRGGQVHPAAGRKRARLPRPGGGAPQRPHRHLRRGRGPVRGRDRAVARGRGGLPGPHRAREPAGRAAQPQPQPGPEPEPEPEPDKLCGLREPCWWGGLRGLREPGWQGGLCGLREPGRPGRDRGPGRVGGRAVPGAGRPAGRRSR